MTKRHTFKSSSGQAWCDTCGFPKSNTGAHLLDSETTPPQPPAKPLPPVGRNVVSIAAHATRTSRAAGARARNTSSSVRVSIVELLAHPSRPALHTEGIIAALNAARAERDPASRPVGHQTVSARITELVRDGWLAQAVDIDGNPITRTTSTGAEGAAWRLTDAGRATRHQERARRA